MMVHYPSGESVLHRSRRVAVAIILAVSLLAGGCDTFESQPDASSDTPPQLEATLVTSGPHCSSGVQASGALFEICVPEGGNPTGTLIVYARGFVFPQLPLQLPREEGGINVRDFVTERSFAYAATSYYTNGVVEPRQGARDLRDLIVQYTQRHGRPERVLLLSFSNGTLLSMLMLEKEGHLFDAALASCGPHGSYAEEIAYLGDVFVLFDYFFRDIDVIPGFGTGVPGGPDGIPPALVEGLAGMAPPGFTGVDVLAQLVVSAMQSHPAVTEQLLGSIQLTSSMSRGTLLFADAAEGVELVVRAVAYNVFATNDALAKLGGRFFDNTTRIYGDLLPSDPLRQALNAGVARYEAERSVEAQLNSRYESKGHLRTTVVALHNTRDPLVPFWQESLYQDDLGTRRSLYELVPVDRYGHCNFTADEIGSGLDALLERVDSSSVASL